MKPVVARVLQRLHREDRVLATEACQVMQLMLAQHAMLLLVDKHRFFGNAFCTATTSSSLLSCCMEAQRVATQHKTLQRLFGAFVCSGTMQNETTTLQSQLMQLRFKLLQPGPPLTQAHSVLCESEGRVTAEVELCNPVIREHGMKKRT